MARGVRASPSNVSTLPKVSFQKTDEDYSLRLFGVHNLQARSYGFNDFSQFQRPKHYIQYIEPIESDLARQVEYDMDEQDQEWLDTVNAERKKEQIDMVSCETFEIIMDRMEKEWFDLTKNIPKTDFAMPSEDSTCAVCDDSEGENSNAIVFCDGCNLAVHQDCYGVPYIPEGQWICRKCTISPENPVSCVLCPNEGGAFKQTVTGDWVHLLCAIWVPETRVASEIFMEPITGVEKIHKQRWKLKCSLCEVKGGACIQCAKSSCFAAFHATCARKEKFLMPMKSTQGSEPVTLTCYCEKHLPKEQLDARAIALERERLAEEEEENSAMLSKSARAYAKTYKPGPPIVPALIINRILNYIAKVQLRKRHDFVQMVARYWSLKREARRGAPLLKRLRLEPWTANGSNVQSDEDRVMKLELLLRLREDLEKVHAMTSLSRRRESRKQAQATVVRDTLLSILAPFENLLRDAFNRIIAIDRNEYFRYPVSKVEVPDYFDIIKKPMYWSMIEDKIINHLYFDTQEFKDDITLVIDNAILYNQANTAYHKTAVRIRSVVQPIFEELDHRLAEAKAGGKRDTQSAEERGSENTEVLAQDRRFIGDLEPPLAFLKLLTSTEAIQDETDLVFDKNPLDSLFSFELAKFKPPPPPPPPPSPKLSKPKRDRKADLERKRKEREAEAAARALAVNGRTRRAAAAAAIAAAQIEGEVEREAEREAEAEGQVEGEVEAEPEAEPEAEVDVEVGVGVGLEAEAEAEGEAMVESESDTGPGAEPEAEAKYEPESELEAEAELEQEERPADIGPSPAVDEETLVAPSKPALALEFTTTTTEEAQTEVAAATELVKRGPPRRRGTSSLPSPSDVPPMVTDVDNRDSFQFFDKGWILPPEQKRGGRRPVERQPLPPPKKRAKTGDYITSRLSVVSTTASENQTLQQTLSAVEAPAAAPETNVLPELYVSNLEAMDVDTSALRTTISEEPTVPPSDATQRELSEEVQVSPVYAPPSVRTPSPSAPLIYTELIPSPAPAPIPVPVPASAPTSAPTSVSAPIAALAMDVPTAPTPPTVPDTFNFDGIQPRRVIKGPDGQVIVEVLDSPLIRKQMTKQKKAKKRRLEQQRLEQLTTARPETEGQLRAQLEPEMEKSVSMSPKNGNVPVPVLVPVAIAGPSRLVLGLDNLEAESELSSLSDYGSDTAEAREKESVSSSVVAPAPQGRRRGPGRKASVPGLGALDDLGSIKAGQVLEGGTLVWAKAKTYPWWPAVVYEYDDPRIPIHVKVEGDAQRRKGLSIYMVQFFDKGRSWQFLSHDKLKMLGEHRELDEELLSAKSIKQRWKSTISRAECRSAYEEAMAEMETSSDIVRAENAAENAAAAAVEGDYAIVDVFESGLSITTGVGDIETTPQCREPTPRSDKMQVDDDEF